MTFFSMGMLPITEGLMLLILYICMLHSGAILARQRSHGVDPRGNQLGLALRRD